MSTNRDLYQSVSDLIERRRADPRSLEEYLRALLDLADAHRSSAGLTADELVHLLDSAFTAPPAPLDASWFDRSRRPEPATGYWGWRDTLVAQIVDLAEMEKSGDLADEQRYFGIDAPRGGRWFNFDPFTFIECGVTGSFGGWQEGDPTGRDYVPGKVAAIDSTGKVVDVDPRDLDQPIVDLPLLTWDLLAEFLTCGQLYE